MLFILIVVVALVAWALHLMQEAMNRREFSLMLAGFLVSMAAAAMMAVYFLMGHYVVYFSQVAHRAQLQESSIEWISPIETWANAADRTVEFSIDRF
jgi:Ca2+/Na+ antiporter